MIDVEPLIVSSFERIFPQLIAEANWDEVLRRAGVARRPGRFARLRRGSLRLSGRRLVLASVAALVLAAAGTGAAFATGLIDSGGTQVAKIDASTSGVADVETVAVSPSGHAGIVEGVKAGAVVVAATIGDSSTPFVALTKLLAGRNIEILTGSGGRAGSVGWTAAAGVVSDRVTRVDVEGANRAVQPVTLVSGTFAVDVHPAFRPIAVVAYDAAGQEIGRAAFPAQTALGS
jgi:hypothetical protein